MWREQLLYVNWMPVHCLVAVRHDRSSCLCQRSWSYAPHSPYAVTTCCILRAIFANPQKQIVHADTRPCYLETELLLLQRANSPSSGVRDHIVQLIEHETDSKRTTLAFEHCEMGDLLKYLQDHGNVPASTAQACIVSILKAVRFLHQLGYAHRDIKVCDTCLPGAGAGHS